MWKKCEPKKSALRNHEPHTRENVVVVNLTAFSADERLFWRETVSRLDSDNTKLKNLCMTSDLEAAIFPQENDRRKQEAFVECESPPLPLLLAC
jgi:hypothetical protein